MSYPDMAISIPRSEWATLKPSQGALLFGQFSISIPRSEWATLKLISAVNGIWFM